MADRSLAPIAAVTPQWRRERSERRNEEYERKAG